MYFLKTSLPLSLLGSLLAASVTSVSASEISAATEETITACEDAAKLLAEQDIDGAMEESYWCYNGIKEMKENQTLAIFPDEVNDYIGGEISNQEVMGMRMIEREYTLDSQTIKVSMTGGGAASAGLAMLAGLGLNMNMGSAKKKIRVQKRAVMDMSEGNSVQYMVTLKSGSMLNISSDNVDADTTLEFVRAFPIAKLDDALGQ
ncbi:MAG: hypothetical protein KTR33_15605 [Gammaproteobacteria bacterium]|nr:hypothetical protein [Gammaproteobacteria bacterium]